MHILIVKNAYQTKCTPSFNISTHPTTTHEFIGAYFKQIPPPWVTRHFPGWFKWEAPCNFYFIKFLPKPMAEAPETPCTPFKHPVPGSGCTGLIPPRTFPPSWTTYLPNFIKIHPVHWISYTYIAPCPTGGGAQIKKQKNLPLLKFDFRQILFYKYCTILKKIYPSRSPLDTCSSWSRG